MEGLLAGVLNRAAERSEPFVNIFSSNTAWRRSAKLVLTLSDIFPLVIILTGHGLLFLYPSIHRNRSSSRAP